MRRSCERPKPGTEASAATASALFRYLLACAAGQKGLTHGSLQAATGMKRSRTWAHTLYSGDTSVPVQALSERPMLRSAQSQSMTVPELRPRRGSRAHQQQQSMEQQRLPGTAPPGNACPEVITFLDMPQARHASILQRCLLQHASTYMHACSLLCAVCCSLLSTVVAADR